MLALYGHPFSSYTWKAQIALYAADIAHEFREVGPEHPEHGEFLAGHAGPWGTFPVLVDEGEVLFEASVIVEHLARRHAPEAGLMPRGDDAQIRERMIDRVFDNYVMTPMRSIVLEHLRGGGVPDADRCDQARGRLETTYAWVENWLAGWDRDRTTGLIECAAAPSLFYADWVHPIGEAYPLLRAWRANLLARPEVARCVDAGRPYRSWFPPGAPDRD